MPYQLIKKETGRKKGKYHYTVVDGEGKILSERNSDRDYIACTINGVHYFGRLDLIGKGDHGKYVKWAIQRGDTPTPIAYLKKEEE